MLTTGLSLYERVAQATSTLVIRQYSTSFGLASRLLDTSSRQHVENIYALVRIADEIVDGVAAEAGIDQAGVRRLLDDLEAQTELAMTSGYSTNLIVHAFASTARSTGFGSELTEPFFRSMRTDLDRAEHTPESFNDYIYGSAEVVGLMCLRGFLLGTTVSASERARLEEGARRLGAAFQKVNFLRDLSADFALLGRSYFPGVSVGSFTETDKNRLLDDIDDDLAVSAVSIRRLPKGSKRAVALAHGLFGELSARLRATPADELTRSRVRVPDPVKLRLAAEAATGRLPKSTPTTSTQSKVTE